MELFGQAIDKLHTMYVAADPSSRIRSPGPQDTPILQGFTRALSAVLTQGATAETRQIAERTASYLADIARMASAAMGPYLTTIDEINSAFGLGQPTAAVPTTTEGILGEWPMLDREAAVHAWQTGLARYDAAPVENRPEMRAAAELMATALATAVRAGGLDQVDVHQAAWNILVACALGNDQSTWDADAERQMRLGLAVVRRLGTQSPQLGGSGSMPVDFFDDTGNRMLMASALSSTPWSFDVEAWFREGG